MKNFFISLISDDSGNISSSRFLTVYLVVFGSVQFPVCAFLGIDSFMTGGEFVTLSVAAMSGIVLKKPFENNHKPNKNNSNRRNGDGKNDWKSDYNFDE